MAATIKPDLIEPLTLPLADVTVHGDGTATGSFVQKNGLPMIPVRFLEQNGWKIDSIGSPEEIQKVVRELRIREIGYSPQHVIQVLQESTASGDFRDTVSCFTDYVRDEWIGEMLVAVADRQSLGGNAIGRWKDSATDQFDNLSQEMMATFSSHQPGLMEAIDGYLQASEIDSVLSDANAEPAARRAACIRLAKNLDDRTELLVKLMETRNRIKPQSCKVAGSLSPPDNPRSSSLSPPIHQAPSEYTDSKFQDGERIPLMDVEFVQVNKLWRLNTVIDPELSPWPS